MAPRQVLLLLLSFGKIGGFCFSFDNGHGRLLIRYVYVCVWRRGRIFLSLVLLCLCVCVHGLLVLCSVAVWRFCLLGHCWPHRRCQFLSSGLLICSTTPAFQSTTTTTMMIDVSSPVLSHEKAPQLCDYAQLNAYTAIEQQRLKSSLCLSSTYASSHLHLLLQRPTIRRRWKKIYLCLLIVLFIFLGLFVKSGLYCSLLQ